MVLSEHYKRWNFNPFNYYEFGTGEGNSLIEFLMALKKLSKELGLDNKRFNIFLFDSFEGLPEYSNLKDKNPAWSRGQYTGTIDKFKQIIYRFLPDIAPNIKFIKGFYENSLTEELRKTLIENPPSVVNVDVDYYSSTKTILEWLYPICQDGTIFYFDDIFEYLGNLSKGEYQAIEEFNKNKRSLGYQFYQFYNFGIPSLTGKIYTLNKINNDKQ